MRELLNKLIEFQPLTMIESERLLEYIVDEDTPDSLIVSAMTALRMRDINATELQGFRKAILKQALKPELKADKAIDVCGTGGDSKNAFNISTLSAITIAGAGYDVIKHGNYGVSSFCGSSTILEHLGYEFTSDNSNLNEQLTETNLCFLHAPLFHPCLKRVGQLRKEMGIRTFFNFLGPLVNPVQPNYQLTGVFDYSIARLYAEILEEERLGFGVVHSQDGYDEISLTSSFKLYSKNEESIIYPYELGFKTLNEVDLMGGDSIHESAEIFQNVLAGKGTQAQTEVVIANAGFGIKCFDDNKALKDCFEEAKEAIYTGGAQKKFNDVIEISKNRVNENFK